MQVLATYNIKGGVGKTAAAVNLSYLAAAEGYRTLVWDLDPQGAASFYFRIKPKVKGKLKQMFSGKNPLEKHIKATDYDNLDLLPADFSYRNMDVILQADDKGPVRMKKLLRPLRDAYDFVFLDCPPSVSKMSEAVFMASSVLLVPTIPTVLSVRTLEQLQEFLRRREISHCAVFPFFSMVDKRRSLHRELLQELPANNPGYLLSQIPYASEVERMGLRRAPIGAFAANSWPSLAYQALWREVKESLRPLT